MQNFFSLQAAMVDTLANRDHSDSLLICIFHGHWILPHQSC